MLRGKRQSLPTKQDAFGTALNAALSIPLALLFGPGIQLLVLGIPGDPTAYTLSLAALGLLTSLDLRRSWKRAILGFTISLPGFIYILQQPKILQNTPPLALADGSAVIAAIPASLSVLAAGFLLSDRTKYKMVMADVFASLGLAVGLGIASSTRSINPFSLLYFTALSAPANAAQIFLLQVLNKFWKRRRLSLAMMPTAFFGYNLVSFAIFLSTLNIDLLYPFISSLAFLPALVFLGIGTGSLSQQPTTPTPNTTPPRITVTGDPLLRQGRQQNLQITTQPGSLTKGPTELKAALTRPGGKVESIKVSKTSDGHYKASYQPKGPGNYMVRVTMMTKGRTAADQSFSFEVQPVPPHHPPPPPPATPYPYRQQNLPQTSPQQQVIPQASTPSHLPKLDNWNPQLWVSQDIHGYTIKEHVATGATGYVLRASFGHGGAEMAIKIPILKPNIGSTALEETMTEATRLLELSATSKYVVQLRGILVDRLNVQEILKGDTSLYLRSPPAIVMEFMKGGTAKRLLEDPSYESVYYSEKWGSIVMMIGQMIATGLGTIHKAGFVHLDVKPQNILFNNNPPPTGSEMLSQLQSGSLVPKLGDLGSAVKVGGKVNQFTSEYAPADQVLGNGAAQSMDVYALGSTIFTMLTKIPFNSRSLIESMNDATRSQGNTRTISDLRSAWDQFNPDFTKVERFSSALSIMKRMLAKDPMQRPDAMTVADSLRSLKSL